MVGKAWNFLRVHKSSNLKSCTRKTSCLLWKTTKKSNEAIGTTLINKTNTYTHCLRDRIIRRQGQLQPRMVIDGSGMAGMLIFAARTRQWRPPVPHVDAAVASRIITQPPQFFSCFTRSKVHSLALGVRRVPITHVFLTNPTLYIIYYLQQRW